MLLTTEIGIIGIERNRLFEKDKFSFEHNILRLYF